MTLGLISVFQFAHANPSTPVAHIDAARSCVHDLAVLPDFLLANDTGAADNRRHRGESAITSALERATQETALVMSSDDCARVLRRYLAAWREGHLTVESLANESQSEKAAGPAAQAQESPAGIRWLSSKTVLLTFRTFAPSAQAPIRDLFKIHQKRLSQTPNWIIDVRQNDGGSDSIYNPIVQATIGHPVFSAGAEFLVTPANIEGHLRICELYAPADTSCPRAIRPLVETMRAAPSGTYVRPPGSSSTFTRIVPDQPKRLRPQRVVVLTDIDCVSSCEQFLLHMRQGWNVKLVGRRTYGALDYSNLRPYSLPSGERVLWYATSRSARLPYLPVDGTGVLPDVLLLPPANEAERAKEVDFVKGLLESRAGWRTGG